MDERENLPSASITERLWLCPGSDKASRGLPELSTPEAAAYAEAGDRVHLWLEAPDFVDLTPWPDELEVGKLCLEQRDKLVDEIFGANKDKAAVLKEKRHWLHHPDGRKRFSGKMDYSAVHHRIGLIVDYKTNRGDVTESARNLQLRAQAVLMFLRHNRNLEKIFVAIIQPLVSSKPEICEYIHADLIAAEKELDAILKASENPAAKRNPGKKQCQFCPAKLKCPEAVSVVNELAEMELADLIGVTGGELSNLLDKCATAETVIKAAKAQAKAVLKENPTAVPNYGLKPNSPMRKVMDPFGVFEALYAAGFMDRDTFIKDCVSVGIGDLEKAIQSKNKLKPKETKNVVAKFVEPFIELKPNEPSLERTV